MDDVEKLKDKDIHKEMETKMTIFRSSFSLIDGYMTHTGKADICLRR